MDYISELNSEHDTEEIKALLPIGLFGSFRKRELLETLKNHLIKKEKFYANISYDLQSRYQQTTGEDPSAYDFRLSKILIEKSKIHIIFFFREEDADDGLNYSATMEIGMLFGYHSTQNQVGRYSLILCETGYDNRNIGGMRRGIRLFTDREWRWHDFDTYEEAQLHATQFCYDCILDYYLRVLLPFSFPPGAP